MRTLSDVPWDAIDRTTGLPRHGSYRGSLRAVDLTRLSPDPLERLARHKRWVWATVTTRELVIAFAVVDLGYAASTFGYAWSATEGMLVDVAQLGLPMLSRVRRTATDRVHAKYASPPLAPKARVEVREPTGGERIEVDVSLPRLSLHGVASFGGGPVPMTAIAPLAGREGGLLNTTEKRVLAPFAGSAMVNGRRFDLEPGDAHFGWDVTEGLLGRTTRWKWAFAQGRTVEGTPFALNLVEGFVGEPECTLWIDGRVVPVGEGRFVHDESDPLRPWQGTSTDSAIDFHVTPTAMHSDRQDLKLIKSRFVQALGLGSGVVRAEGKEHRFEGVPIIVEDQDMLW